MSIENPGAVIAAIPGWLGYSPRRSVVLILFSAKDTPEDLLRATQVTRIDLYTSHGSINTQAIAMAAFADCALHRPDAMCTVLVDDTLDTTTPAHRYRDLLVLLADRTAVWNARLMEAWATPAIVPDQPWWSLLPSPGPDIQPAPTTHIPGAHGPEPDGVF